MDALLTFNLISVTKIESKRDYKIEIIICYISALLLLYGI